MLARFQRLHLRAAILAFSGLLFASGSSWADTSCKISTAAGKPLPSPVESADPSRFRIFWQIATQIEDLADAEGRGDAMADIKAAAAMADGYYIAALLSGPLTYWPDRPPQCALNFRRVSKNDQIEVDGEIYNFEEDGDTERKKCRDAQAEFVSRQSASPPNVRDVQIDALNRVFRNLDLAGEQKRGKPVWGSTLVRADDFSYDKDADRVVMKELPDTYCIMNAYGITLNGQLVYQEPHIQQKKDQFVWIPRRNKKGKLVYAQKALVDALPLNTRAFDLIGDAFTDARVPVSNMRANVRRWNARRSPRMVQELAAIPEIGGFNFEGGSRIISSERRVVENFAQGMSWILKNTDRDISLLMPGFWSRDMIGNDDEIDELTDRVRATVLQLNAKLTTAMGLPEGKNAICTSRMTLIVGSYGQPINVKPLPMMRKGRPAGTVTGQIKLLSDIRKELCGA